MNTKMFGLIAFLAIPAFAGQNCTLKAGEGPFKSFSIANKKLSVTWSESSGRVYETELIETLSAITLETSDAKAYYFDVDDWGAGQLVFVKDDDGTAAFTHFYSDSSTVSGYYRCK